MISSLIHLAEKGILPDFLIRIGIKKLSKVRLDLAKNSSPGVIEKRHQNWVDKMKESPIALVPEKANEQHYEVPPEFFEIVLGSNLKYSSGYWPEGDRNLDESEDAMLKLSCQRAEIDNGQSILELGCGTLCSRARSRGRRIFTSSGYSDSRSKLGSAITFT